jgi:hypothetical protein
MTIRRYFVWNVEGNVAILLRMTAAYRSSLLYRSCLKVPKREIFDRLDFPDFYTIKSLRVGDFGVKIKKNLLNI